MSKKRRLAGLASGSKLITPKHLAGKKPAESTNSAGSDDAAELKERLQKEIILRDKLVAEQVQAQTADLRAQSESAIAAKDADIQGLRQELEQAEAKAWELEQQLEGQVADAREGGAALPGAYELRLLQPEEFGVRPMDSDEIHERDILEMVDMIIEQGLLQWPIVDSKNRPLAGRRRSFAIQRIAEEQPEQYQAIFPQGVPVIAMLEIDWDADPLLADQEMLLMQHTQRRRDKPAVRDQKIRQLAERMRTDPNAKWKGGRTSPGEYHALKRLTQLFGVSDKIVQRALSADAGGEEANPWQSAHLTLSRQLAAAEKAVARLGETPPGWQEWQDRSRELISWLDQRREG